MGYVPPPLPRFPHSEPPQGGSGVPSWPSSFKELLGTAGSKPLFQRGGFISEPRVPEIQKLDPDEKPIKLLNPRRKLYLDE